jgi:hypothetical protein
MWLARRPTHRRYTVDTDTATPTINVELLRQELCWVTEHPRQHDQNLWIDNPRMATYPVPAPAPGENWACDTTACLAGWTAIHQGWAPVWEPYGGGGYVTRDGVRRHAPDVAQEELGLTPDQRRLLFFRAGTVAELWDAASQITDGAIPSWADSPYHPVMSLPPASA